MVSDYKSWISSNVPDNCQGLCKKFATLMFETFPELRLVRGHYIDLGGHYHAHWWCEDINDNVIDPTASQFTAHGFYEEFVGPEPVGRCLECGCLTYHDPQFCDVSCSTAFRQSLLAVR